MNSSVFEENALLLLLLLPLEGRRFVLVTNIIDGMVRTQVFGHLLSLPVIDLLDLPEMTHVDLVPHLFLDNAGGCRIDHHCFHSRRL